MPKSRVRKRPDGPARLDPVSSSGAATSRAAARGLAPSPRWYAIVMSALFVIGLAYIVVWYFAPTNALMNGLGSWNLAVGFAIMVVGLVMAVRWR